MTFRPTEEQMIQIELARAALRQALEGGVTPPDEAFFERCSSEIGASVDKEPAIHRQPHQHTATTPKLVVSALRLMARR